MRDAAVAKSVAEQARLDAEAEERAIQEKILADLQVSY